MLFLRITHWIKKFLFLLNMQTRNVFIERECRPLILVLKYLNTFKMRKGLGSLHRVTAVIFFCWFVCWIVIMEMCFNFQQLTVSLCVIWCSTENVLLHEHVHNMGLWINILHGQPYHVHYKTYILYALYNILYVIWLPLALKSNKCKVFIKERRHSIEIMDFKVFAFFNILTTFH